MCLSGVHAPPCVINFIFEPSVSVLQSFDARALLSPDYAKGRQRNSPALLEAFGLKIMSDEL